MCMLLSAWCSNRVNQKWDKEQSWSERQLMKAKQYTCQQARAHKHTRWASVKVQTLEQTEEKGFNWSEGWQFISPNVCKQAFTVPGTTKYFKSFITHKTWFKLQLFSSVLDLICDLFLWSCFSLLGKNKYIYCNVRNSGLLLEPKLFKTCYSLLLLFNCIGLVLQWWNHPQATHNLVPHTVAYHAILPHHYLCLCALPHLSHAVLCFLVYHICPEGLVSWDLLQSWNGMGRKGTKRPSSSNLPSVGIATRPGCLEPHPTWPCLPPGTEHPKLQWASVSASSASEYFLLMSNLDILSFSL